MKIEKGILISIEESDIKKGILALPKKVKVISDKCLMNLETLEKVIAPGLIEIGSYNFYECNALTSFEAPVLAQIGSYNFYECNALTSFEAPVLAQIGSDNFYECNALTSFEAPVLAQIGSYNFYECNALKSVKFGQLSFNVKSVDGLLTIIEKSKTSKGIHIHTGFIFITMNNGDISKKETFLTEKEGFFAHGETVKKSIGDLNFKIVVERLKNDPIYEDTVITDMYYRTVTGACEQGVKNWREQNNITVDKITAKELLPILEKSNAYGVEKFRKLVKFND